MLLLPCLSSVRVWTPAKINLFLEVLGRRADGYHDLATLMVCVGLYDRLDFQPDSSGLITLQCDQPNLSTGPDNLVYRAARLVQERFSIRQGVRIFLAKRIPMAAGLAGGSSDAAATLAALNQMWQLGLSREGISKLGAELGSDVSFFFHGPAAWCTGRGEIVEAIRPGRSLHLVLATPVSGLSTASVFKALRLSGEPVDGGVVRDAFIQGDTFAITRALHNRLEGPAFALSPEVERLKSFLRASSSFRSDEANSSGVLMSGSGSTVFAIARDADDAHRLARLLVTAREGGASVRVNVVRSCD
jgi:4-diphosphocytidyl-2-C-methyl-D-erythritol kinase